MTDFWSHDPDKCKICRGTRNIGKPGVLEHLLLVLQQSGEIEGKMMDGELKYRITPKGIDSVENSILPELNRRVNRRKQE